MNFLYTRDGRNPASADKRKHTHAHKGLARAYATGSISTYISMCVLRHGLLNTEHVVKGDDCISAAKLYRVGASGND